MFDTTDLTPAQQDAAESALAHTPSDEDMAWYMEASYVDPAERDF